MQSEAAQLDDMRESAYRLGMAFAQAAEAEGELDRKLLLFDAFQRSFASVRLSIALEMRLRREAHRPAWTETEAAETEVERAEAPERPDDERPERYDERDRERDAERASFPLLLRTLEQVAGDAERLLPQAAELPSLREVLDRVKGRPAPLVSRQPPPTAPLRALLSGGTAALTLSPPGPGRLPGGLRGVPPRRATGPPRR